MNLFAAIRTFFNGAKPDRGDPVDTVLAGHQAFSDAVDAYNAIFDQISTQTDRANRRNIILRATNTLNNALPSDTEAAEAYDRAVSAFTDPADFKPYTEADLDAHTAAMNNCFVAQKKLTAAFASLSPSGNIYATAARLFKSYCDIYERAASAYFTAADSAIIAALEGNLQAAKDECDVGLLELRTNKPSERDPAAAKVKALALKAKSAENAANASSLEQKAKLAKGRAVAFIAEAEAAQSKAVEALGRHIQAGQDGHHGI